MTIYEDINLVRKAIVDLDTAISEKLNSVELQELCALLVDLNRVKDEFGIAYSSLVHKVSEALADADELSLEDGSKIEKKWSTDRRGWKHKQLASEVANRLALKAIDMDTGEITMSPQEVAERVLDYVQPSYWRIKQLSDLGINADSYCEVGESKSSIIVRKAK